MVPKVSIVMPVLNGAAFIEKAIRSIVTQSVKEWELVVVDDGSSDGSQNIVRKWGDSRIHLLQNDRTCGASYCMNRGIDSARGEYVGRMDCDDVSLPERLAVQADYFDRYPVGLLGTGFYQIEEESDRVSLFQSSLTDAELHWRFLFQNPVCSSSVMLRKEVLIKYGLRHDETLRSSLDYDFWTRVANVCETRVLPDPLVVYRRHASGISGQLSGDQKKNAIKISCRQLSLVVKSPGNVQVQERLRERLENLFLRTCGVLDRLALEDYALLFEAAGTLMKKHPAGAAYVRKERAADIRYLIPIMPKKREWRTIVQCGLLRDIMLSLMRWY
jgi:glycosyltransferase involved in cell wall biosynthesis